MKKLILALFLVLFFSCNKESDPEDTEFPFDPDNPLVGEWVLESMSFRCTSSFGGTTTRSSGSGSGSTADGFVHFNADGTGMFKHTRPNAPFFISNLLAGQPDTTNFRWTWNNETKVVGTGILWTRTWKLVSADQNSLNFEFVGGGPDARFTPTRSCNVESTYTR